MEKEPIIKVISRSERKPPDAWVAFFITRRMAAEINCRKQAVLASMRLFFALLRDNK